jgi:hypothetical protein
MPKAVCKRTAGDCFNLQNHDLACMGDETNKKPVAKFMVICKVNRYSSMCCVHNQIVYPSGFIEREKFECVKITGVSRLITSSHSVMGLPTKRKRKKEKIYSGPEWFLIDGVFFLNALFDIKGTCFTYYLSSGDKGNNRINRLDCMNLPLADKDINQLQRTRLQSITDQMCKNFFSVSKNNFPLLSSFSLI